MEGKETVGTGWRGNKMEGKETVGTERTKGREQTVRLKGNCGLKEKDPPASP